MSTDARESMTADDYERAAQEYLAKLPLEHFMESTPQATQREITVASLALLKHRGGDVHHFNELLVQYFYKGRVRQVVPDNMLIRTTRSQESRSNFAIDLEPDPPFLVMEYVSPSNPRKDYDDNLQRYERQLKVPYYIVFYPEKQDLRVFRHDGQRYIRLEPDATGRYALAELDVRIGLLNHWVRFWHKGDLLELPAELDEHLDQMTEQLRAAIEQLNQRTEELEKAQRQLESTHQQLASTSQELVNAQTAYSSLADRVGQLLALQVQGVEALRRAVQERAEGAGRNDLIQQMTGAADVAQLSRWYLELI